MGYTTEFQGQFDLDRELDEDTYTFLCKLNDTRRVKRNVGSEYGIEGEFYAEDDNNGVIDYNNPPGTQPGLWCGWVPTDDKLAIEWDQGEKFYDYIDWIKYIIEKILSPKGYVLNGTVIWRGEAFDDIGKIIVCNNEVTYKRISIED